MTDKTVAVLLAFLQAGPKARLHGFEIMRSASILSGTLYPILERFKAAGWIVDEWEEPAPEGRPRRRYYQLTELGYAQANAASVRAEAISGDVVRRLRPRTAPA